MVCALVARSDTVLGAVARLLIAMALVLVAGLTGDLLLPLAPLTSTGFCTAGKAAIAAAAERVAEAPAEAAVLTAAEAAAEAPVEAEAPVAATTAVALDALDA
jgi:hypothetical protein